MSRYSIHRNAGYVFHVMNRATRGQVLFRDASDYLSFQALLAHALERRPTRMLGYCLMPNHWHMALWPSTDHEITAFAQWFSAIHARRLHRKRGTSGVVDLEFIRTQTQCGEAIGPVSIGDAESATVT